MGALCCIPVDDREGDLYLANNGLLRHQPSTINPVEIRDNDREITIDNQSNVPLHIMITNSSISRRDTYTPSISKSHSTEIVESKENMFEFESDHQKLPEPSIISIWSKEEFAGYKHTYIKAWIFDQGTSDEKIQDEYKERIIEPGKNISPNQDIFIFDGNKLRTNKSEPYPDAFVVSDMKYISMGEFFIMPSFFTMKKSLMDWKAKYIKIDNVRHTLHETFKLIPVENSKGYCKVVSKGNDSYWTILENGRLSLRNNDDKSLNVQFRIETMAASDITVRIYSRYKALYLTLNGQHDAIYASKELDADDPLQRFMLQKP
eukprot:512007_1